MRLTVEDRSGVIAKISQILGDADISIASVLQREAPETHSPGHVPLIMMLHTARDIFGKALEEFLRRLHPRRTMDATRGETR